MMDVSVVIPVRNAAATLGAQLQALATQDYPGPWEVIVADNESRDDSCDLALAFADRLTLRVVDASDKPGAAHARNVGARASAGSALLFCDADDMVDPGWIGAMTTALKESPLVGGRLEYLVPPENARTVVEPFVGELRVHLGFLPMAPTANIAARRFLYDQLDGFDEQFPLASAEDVDFCWRAQLGGAHFSYCDGAVVRYRSSDDLRGELRRSWAYGQGDAVLLKKFSRYEIPDRSLRPVVREIASGVRHARRKLRTQERRADWLVHLVYLAGRLRGAVGQIAPYATRVLES